MKKKKNTALKNKDIAGIFTHSLVEFFFKYFVVPPPSHLQVTAQ